VKREPRLERLTAASQALRRRLPELESVRLAELRELLEKALELEVLDRDAIRELENGLLG
jgi:hypothetical protein